MKKKSMRMRAHEVGFLLLEMAVAYAICFILLCISLQLTGQIMQAYHHIRHTARALDTLRSLQGSTSYTSSSNISYERVPCVIVPTIMQSLPRASWTCASFGIEKPMMLVSLHQET